MSKEIQRHDILDRRARERVLSYAAGLLEGKARQSFEKHIAAGCPACQTELDALNHLAGVLSLAGPTVEPPARLRERIRQIPREALVVRAESGVWKVMVPGVTIKDLEFEPQTNRRTFLCRMEPGTAIPAHRHEGPEQCFVLEGELVSQNAVYRAGDYVREAAGTPHAEARTEKGCLLLLIGNGLRMGV